MKNSPKMHVSNLQIFPILEADGTGTLEVHMTIKMQEGKLGRAAVTLYDGEEKEILFHNMLLPGNMRMPIKEESGQWTEIQAQISPRRIGTIEQGEEAEYILYICLYDENDRKVEGIQCPISFID